MGYKQERQYRFKNYNYASCGYYYVTICTKGRKYLFGSVKNQKMNLSKLGRITNKYWTDIAEHFPYVRLDEHVVMPNHLHGIVIIDHGCMDGKKESSGRSGISVFAEATPDRYSGLTKRMQGPVHGCLLPNDPYNKSKRLKKKIIGLQPQKKSLSIIIRVFKAAVTKWSRDDDLEYDVWQPRFHDRIIRDEDELERIREYIRNNPANWDEDGLR
jgi:putative transposase